MRGALRDDGSGWASEARQARKSRRRIAVRPPSSALVPGSGDPPLLRAVPFAVGAAALFGTSVTAGKFNKKLSVGDAAPVYRKLPGTDGKDHSLADLEKKDIVVIVMTCNSCTYSNDYEGR